MGFGVWMRFLVGEGAAIRRVAESRSAFPVGIALVLITAIPRSYDQTFITEAPLRWLLGPLAFSTVSGTWLYLVIRAASPRPHAGPEGAERSSILRGWTSFMGLFWMTAPVAWLYAIPVERFLEPVSAARANVSLLAIVSLWRVLLMTRVVRHLSALPFRTALARVLFAASVEVLAVIVLASPFARALMASMGGMRNSPSEQVLIDALGWAFLGAAASAPVALVLSLVGGGRGAVFPPAKPDRMPWPSLGITAVVWVAVAVAPQHELSHNVVVERWVVDGRCRRALDYLAVHDPRDFAPSRPLPPDPYEREIFEQLPACVSAARPSDPAWVREHLIARLDEATVHFAPGGAGRLAALPVDQRASLLRWQLRRSWLAPARLVELVSALERLPEGRRWLASNAAFVDALRLAARDLGISRGARDAHGAREWTKLAEFLDRRASAAPDSAIAGEDSRPPPGALPQTGQAGGSTGSRRPTSE